MEERVPFDSRQIDEGVRDCRLFVDLSVGSYEVPHGMDECHPKSLPRYAWYRAVEIVNQSRHEFSGDPNRRRGAWGREHERRGSPAASHRQDGTERLSLTHTWEMSLIGVGNGQMQAAMESCPAKTVLAGTMGFALGGAFGLFMSSV